MHLGVLRQYGVRCLIVAACSVGLSSNADAQWYKPWRWGRSRPAPTAPMPQAPQYPQSGIPGAPAMGAVPQGGMSLSGAPVGTYPGAAAQGPPAPVRSPAEQAEIDALVQRAKARDITCDSTAGCANERLTLWKMVQLQDPSNRDAMMRYMEAQRAFDEATRREAQVQQVQQAQAQDRAARLSEAKGLLASGDLDAASAIVDDVLLLSPSDPTGGRLRSAIYVAQNARRVYMRIGLVAIVSLILLIVAFFVGRAIYRRRKAAATEAAAERAGRRAVLQVVDGVGRGRSLIIETDRVSIGACAERGTQSNDLVLSDADHQISRFHCVIERKNGKFFVVDASANGTAINGRTLTRGETRRLRDGDMLVLARSARVRFALS